jgi:hypothetical protein
MVAEGMAGKGYVFGCDTKNNWVHWKRPETQLLSLRCNCITMVQAAESRQGLNLAPSPRVNCCWPTCWRVLRET